MFSYVLSQYRDCQMFGQKKSIRATDLWATEPYPDPDPSVCQLNGLSRKRLYTNVKAFVLHTNIVANH